MKNFLAQISIFVLFVFFLILYITDKSNEKQEVKHSSIRVDETTYKAEWPVTVSSGYLDCEGHTKPIFITDNGQKYALNGIANTLYPEIDSIWKDKFLLDGRVKVKVDISGFRNLALKQCK